MLCLYTRPIHVMKCVFGGDNRCGIHVPIIYDKTSNGMFIKHQQKIYIFLNHNNDLAIQATRSTMLEIQTISKLKCDPGAQN